MSKPENPPAFPCTGEGYQSEKYTQYGMTLRDWFAGMAMAGQLANPRYLEAMEAAVKISTTPYNQIIAEDCYRVADAMLAAREQSQ